MKSKTVFIILGVIGGSIILYLIVKPKKAITVAPAVLQPGTTGTQAGLISSIANLANNIFNKTSAALNIDYVPGFPIKYGGSGSNMVDLQIELGVSPTGVFDQATLYALQKSNASGHWTTNSQITSLEQIQNLITTIGNANPNLNV